MRPEQYGRAFGDYDGDNLPDIPIVLTAESQLINELRDALDAVVGHGYCENNRFAASQDFVGKSAIARVRSAISKVNAQYGERR